MQMSQGVEWALHVCLDLSWLEGPAPTSKLARFRDLPAHYLNKQLQALVRAGILRSTPGPKGGFVLAMALDDISLLDVVVAIEGTKDVFRCTDLLQLGVPEAERGRTKSSCRIAQGMYRAELAWRSELAAQSLGGIRDDLMKSEPDLAREVRDWFASA